MLDGTLCKEKPRKQKTWQRNTQSLIELWVIFSFWIVFQSLLSWTFSFIIMKIKLPMFSFFGQALRETTAFHQMTKFWVSLPVAMVPGLRVRRGLAPRPLNHTCYWHQFWKFLTSLLCWGESSTYSVASLSIQSPWKQLDLWNRVKEHHEVHPVMSAQCHLN